MLRGYMDFEGLEGTRHNRILNRSQSKTPDPEKRGNGGVEKSEGWVHGMIVMHRLSVVSVVLGTEAAPKSGRRSVCVDLGIARQSEYWISLIATTSILLLLRHVAECFGSLQGKCVVSLNVSGQS